MTYAYDDYVQMPTKDLYDTAVMKMAIEAAKDMYDKGQAQMENFYKTYGDFMSPFAADMQKYGAAMDYVRKTVNDAYARGIDLFKSPEGRAIVAQLSHSVDPLWYNTARQNAKVGYAYLDAVKEAMRKGEYDEGLENFILNQEGGLGSFANFSSEGGRIWDRTAPSRFQDINQWTHHLFDNMELSYDPELSKKYPGYLAYSKSKDVMNTIVANNLATLAGTDLGKYMISRYEDQFKALGYSDSDATKKAVDMLQKNIVNANWEQSQIKLQEDPYYKADYEQQLKIDLENIKHQNQMEEIYGKEDAKTTSGTGSKSGSKSGGKEGRNYLMESFDKGGNYFMYGNSEIDSDDDEKIAKNAKGIINKSIDKTKDVAAANNRMVIEDGKISQDDKKEWVAARDAYMNSGVVAKNLLDAEVLANGLGRPVDKSKTSAVFMRAGDKERLVDTDELVSRTVGAGKNILHSDLSKLEKYDTDNLIMQFTNETYTAPMRTRGDNGRSARMQQYQKVIVYGKTSKDRSEPLGEYWFPIQQGRVYRSSVTSSGARYYPGEFGNEWDPTDSGEYQANSSRIEKYLGASQTAFDNSQTRP